MDERPWFKNYDKGVPQHIEYPEIPLHQLLEDASPRLSRRTLHHF